MATIAPAVASIPAVDGDKTGSSSASSTLNYVDDLTRKRRFFIAFESNKWRELAESQLARRYYNSKHWTEDEVERLEARKQPVVWNNLIRRKVDFIAGAEQRTRRDPRAYGRNPDREHDADTATGCVRYVCNANQWPQRASEGFSDGLVSGIGAVFIGIKQHGQLGRDVDVQPVAVDRFFYDPRSVRPDFSDARFIGLHLWLDVDDAKSRWPDKADQFDALMDRTNSNQSALKSEEDRWQQWADFEGRRIRVVEFWELTMQDAPAASPDPLESGQVAPLPKVPAWTYCYFVDDMDLESGPSPYLTAEGMSEHPYYAWSPYIDERGDRHGIVRDMRPLNDEVNKRRSKLLHMVNVKQTFARKGVLADPDDFRLEIAKPDGFFEINGTWGEDVGIVDQGKSMEGQAELLAEAKADLENIGPNPGLTGKGGNVADASGRSLLTQRDSGMTELSPVFDRARDWKLRCYRAMWARARQAWTAPRFIRVTENPDSVKFIGLNQYSMGQHPVTGQPTLQSQNVLSEIDVDLIMDEGPDVITMQEEMLQNLSQLGPGACPPEVLVELSNVPNKERILQMLQQAKAPPPQVAALQQAMAKLEGMLKAANVDKLIADAELSRAKAEQALAQVGMGPDALQQFPYATPQLEMQGGGPAPQLPAPPPQGRLAPPAAQPGPPGAPPTPMPGGPAPNQPPGPQDFAPNPQLSPKGALPLNPRVAAQVS